MPKILIIEDEETIRRVLKKVLHQEDKNYEIIEAVDGVDGVSKINSNKFDLILCDIKMPKKDGIEVLRHVLKECPNTPTIMISGHGDLETAVESMRIGAFDYISKPPDLNRLLNSVRSALLNNNFIKKGKVKSNKSNEYNIIGESHPITSAVKDKAGKFEAANGGTIFLDGIGDMSMSAQSKVLRALQEHKIQRVGSERDLIVDVRVIAATNKKLRSEIENNNFREDLFHRLAVIEVNVPSLNDRVSDIPLLVEHFLKDISKDSGADIKTMDKEAVNKLKEFNWSGNVRELRNVIERLIILVDIFKIKLHL